MFKGSLIHKERGKKEQIEKLECMIANMFKGLGWNCLVNKLLRKNIWFGLVLWHINHFK